MLKRIKKRGLGIFFEEDIFCKIYIFNIKCLNLKVLLLDIS
jgi:hypothetical protein